MLRGKTRANCGSTARLLARCATHPHGDMAMHGQRYPITEIGLLNLVRRLIEVARQDMQHGECEVKYFPGAKINGRSATMIQVVHPVQRAYFTYYLARVFIDDQSSCPSVTSRTTGRRSPARRRN